MKLFIPSLSNIIEYVNYHYYSKPMTVINFEKLSLPIPTSLTRLKSNHGHEFLMRKSHGILHTLSAMELIDKIDHAYTQHVVGYSGAIQEIANCFDIESDDLLMLIRIAVLFHDSAREGDGMDLWDPQSAEACKKYLLSICKLEASLAELIADLVQYKDEQDVFITKHQAIHRDIDYLRQLVNMADTLEVLRCRDVFKPQYMPIANHVKPEIMLNTIIPELVVPHRMLIIEQGRLTRKARIQYQNDAHKFDDTKYTIDSKTNELSIVEAYVEKARKFEFSIFEITEDNLDDVIDKVLRGINTYKDNYKSSGIQFFHNGFFSPRYHGSLGRNRANVFEAKLKHPGLTSHEKLEVLYALFTNNDGFTLRDEVLRSMNQVNVNVFVEQLKDLIGDMNNAQEKISTHIQDANCGYKT
ncbi:hypothetical protein ELY21_14865 [Legionella sp. km535]|uniref:hypothetical protein n=1 Tax=Legionella sp. km535 TaxID=2498107 RepID=UPI000F8DC5C5|nr:hypothetical protein [Legionella sp. km535]RUR15282.1 hypothetical protein ELY21_14865 [Legionella sp. km535]